MGCNCISLNDKITYGIFICPICKQKSGYDKWQKRGDKWIFHKPNAWYGSEVSYPFITDEACWKQTGGSNAENWNSNKWICLICKYETNTFLDYIPDYKGTKEYELSREKRKNDFLTNELINHKIENNILNKEANLYSSALIKQEREIKILNNRIRDMEEQMDKEDDIIVINFRSTDNRVNEAIGCKRTDLFVRAEELLYEKYPKYRNFNYTFTANGRPVKRFKTLDENNIHNNDMILLNII